MLNKLCHLSVAALAVTAMSPAWADINFSEVLDPGPTFYFEVQDTRELQQEWKEHPLREFFTQEQIKDYFFGLMDVIQQSADAETDEDIPSFTELWNQGKERLEAAGISVEEYYEAFDGQSVAYITMNFDALMSAVMEQSGEEMESVTPEMASEWASFYILSEHSDRELVTRAIQVALDDPEKPDVEMYEKDTYKDVTLILSSEESSAQGFAVYFVGDEYSGATMTRAAAETMIDRLAGDYPTESLSVDPEFLRARTTIGGADTFGFVDVKSIMKALEKAALAGLESQRANLEGQGIAAPEKIIEVFGLSKIETAVMGTSLDESDVRFKTAWTYSGDGGLFGRMISIPDKPLEIPGFVPPTATSASVALFDLNQTLDAILDAFAQIAPSYHQMYLAYKQNLSQQAGVDLDAALLRNFGDLIVNFSGEPVSGPVAVPEGAPDAEQVVLNIGSVVAMELKDPQLFQQGLRSILQAFGMAGFLQESEFMGATLFTVPQMDPAAGGTSSFGFAGDFLAIVNGPDAYLKESISRFKAEGVDSLFETALVEGLRARLPADPYAVIYYDGAQLMDLMITAFEAGYNQTGPQYDPEGELIDKPVLPARPDLSDAELKLVAQYYELEGAYVAEGIISTSEQP